MSFSRPLATVLTTAALTLAGCAGHADHDGAAHPSATGSSAPTTTTATDRAAADALPADFPPDVPVIKGDIQSDYRDPIMPGGAIWTLTVTGIDAGSYDKAEQLLLGAGFKSEPLETHTGQDRCDRQSNFSNYSSNLSSYVVLLCSRASEPQYTLEYTVNVYS